MALLTKREVSALTGVPTKNISNYIKRRKLVLTGDYIDDTIDTNAYFIQKWSTKLEVRQELATETENAETLAPRQAPADPYCLDHIVQEFLNKDLFPYDPEMDRKVASLMKKQGVKAVLIGDAINILVGGYAEAFEKLLHHEASRLGYNSESSSLLGLKSEYERQLRTTIKNAADFFVTLADEIIEDNSLKTQKVI